LPRRQVGTEIVKIQVLEPQMNTDEVFSGSGNDGYSL